MIPSALGGRRPKVPPKARQKTIEAGRHTLAVLRRKVGGTSEIQMWQLMMADCYLPTKPPLVALYIRAKLLELLLRIWGQLPQRVRSPAPEALSW